LSLFPIKQFFRNEVEQRMRGRDVEEASGKATSDMLRTSRQQTLAIVSQHRP